MEKYDRVLINRIVIVKAVWCLGVGVQGRALVGAWVQSHRKF